MPNATRLLLAVLLAGIFATPAAAAPKKNPKSPQQTASYWTSERMKNAKPRERARPGGGGGGGGTSDWSRFAVPLAGSAYAGENRKNGKVFFTIDGANYVCSGTAVDASAGINLVWTAGHCVTDGPGHAATNFMFVPGYYKGQEPNGRWAFTVLDSTPGWEGQGANRFRYDVGAARVVNSASPSATFGSTIGTRPIAFGQNPTGKRLVSYGYPAAGKFNGSQQYACASPFRRWDVSALLDPMQISCDMTGGSSGGGWILDANANGIGDAGESVVSVNSYGYSFEKTTMYGPYMPSGGEAQALYDALK
ncbi:MAG: trypsin-like serine peptidase [Solirubrobacteraceae bacterium]